MNFLEPFISPLIDIIKCLSEPVVRRIVYIKDLRTNFEKLNRKAGHLFGIRDDKRHEIIQQGHRKVATSECENWLKEVDEMEHQVNEIREEYNREDGQCLRRPCLNIQLQWKLGKRVFDTIELISDLIVNSKFETVRDALPQVETKPAPTIHVETSTSNTLCNVLECVRNPEKHKIGIWGMGGIGKTTVMQNLNNLEELKKIFNIVIWVTVSKDCSIRKIQNDIANRLSLKFENVVSDERVASELCENLKTKTFLLLMDDVWDKVDLDDVGVPCPNQNGSKVVLTTRYKEVCNKMETDEEIKVEPLPSKEAWKLFREKAGEVVDLPRIHPVATSVVAECAGLPLAISVIGASLRKEDDIHVWNNALEELSSPDTSNMKDMEDRVFKRLRFSFDRLEDDNLRNCFSYAALFPEDYEIQADEIIEYWMVEGFISSSLNLIETCNKGYAILKKLIDASLLESMDHDMWKGKRVKMHDVIRDLALKITSAEREGCKFFVRAGTRMEQPLENKQWEQVKRISLMENQLRKLPERPYCPDLLTFLLLQNIRLTTIPESFFETMHSLRVLDLSNTGIESLPPSIRNLVSLRGLYLKYCHCLETLPPEIGALKSLEVLDADGSSSCYLPYEIGNLSHLRVLKFASFGAMHASGFLRRLSLLEQLITPIASKYMPPAGCRKARIKDPLLEDICCLKKLKRLRFHFLKVKHLEYFLQMSSPWKEGSIMAFDFTVGMNLSAPFYPSVIFMDGKSIPNAIVEELHSSDKNLRFKDGKSIPNAIVEVLRYSNSFNLVQNRSIRRLCEFGVGNMKSLKKCEISDCNEMEIVLDGAQITDIALPNLETLRISNLPNLKSVCNDLLHLGSLACLKSLGVHGCDKLEKIFSVKTIQQLSNLEHLSIDNCRSVTEVIHEEEAGLMFDCILPKEEAGLMFDCILPKLRCLNVSNLSALVSILKGCSLSCPSLEEIRVYECPKLKRLPKGIDKASKLQKIGCDRKWWDELEWDDNAIKLQLQLLVSQKLFLADIFTSIRHNEMLRKRKKEGC